MKTGGGKEKEEREERKERKKEGREGGEREERVSQLMQKQFSFSRLATLKTSLGGAHPPPPHPFCYSFFPFSKSHKMLLSQNEIDFSICVLLVPYS